MSKEAKGAQERSTRREAAERYPDEWIVFMDTRLDDETQSFVDGVVSWHGKDQKEAYRQSAKIEGEGIRANYYTGSIPFRRVTLRQENENTKENP